MRPRRSAGSPYDFPLYGTASWGDTYGAGRSDVPGGWHHGDDLFAKLGTPVVAVADGTIFAVGWNRVGGWRLWLRDELGNAFYYAHLSGYTALSKDNRQVSRGEVLGFVGNTGDAHTTDPHLHFEVHPNTLLYLGYDGAVDPTTYLAGWHRAEQVRILPPVDLPSRAPAGQGSSPTTAACSPCGHLPGRYSGCRCRSWSSGPRPGSPGGKRRNPGPGRLRSRAPLVAAALLLLVAVGAVGVRRLAGAIHPISLKFGLVRADKNQDERGQMNPIPDTLSEDIENGRVPLGRLLSKPAC